MRALEAQAATLERVEIVVEKTVEVADPELLRRVEAAEAELARLRGVGGEDPVGAIADEIAKAKAELEEVQAAVDYWRSGEGELEEAKRFIDSLRKVIWPVENRLGDLERTANGGGLDLSAGQCFDVRRWATSLRRAADLLDRIVPPDLRGGSVVDVDAAAPISLAARRPKGRRES
jgi:hypothetical protein